MEAKIEITENEIRLLYSNWHERHKQVEQLIQEGELEKEDGECSRNLLEKLSDLVCLQTDVSVVAELSSSTLEWALNRPNFTIGSMSHLGATPEEQIEKNQDVIAWAKARMQKNERTLESD